jgi:hypothetical protein
MPEKRIFAKAGHICMMCGFKATTKNKYRELQDHLVRRHFQERIKAALPTRRPFMCPDHSCTVEGKDWQALMRHYTGKHGVLEAYLKEFLARQAEHKENFHQTPLPPTNKIGCRRKRHKRHSSEDHTEDPMAAEDGTEDPPQQQQQQQQQLQLQHQQQQQQQLHQDIMDNNEDFNDVEASTMEIIEAAAAEASRAEANGETILQLDDSDPADLPPTHLALVLKRRRIGKDGVEEEPEETYAFVDLKYFHPISANQYVMKSQVLDPSHHPHHHPGGGGGSYSQLVGHHHNHQQIAPPLQLDHDGGGVYYESAVQSCNASAYFESFPQPTSTAAVAAAAVDYTLPASSTASSSTVYIPADAFITSTRGADGSLGELMQPQYQQQQQQHHSDQVVPSHHQTPSPPATANLITDPNCASEVEVSTTLVQYEDENHQPIVMEVPIINQCGSAVHATVSVVDPKGLYGRGCSKVVVETVKSIPMDEGGAVSAANNGNYEHYQHHEEVASLNGMKEIDFTMF